MVCSQALHSCVGVRIIAVLSTVAIGRGLSRRFIRKVAFAMWAAICRVTAGVTRLVVADFRSSLIF
jgi:hypothetical protein